MALLDEVLNELRSLSPSQLKEAAALVTGIRKQKPLAGPRRKTRHLAEMSDIQALCEMLPTGILLLDENGGIAFTNSSARELFGFQPGELENQPVSLLIPDVAASFSQEQPKTEIALDRELCGKRKDGSEISLQIGWSSFQLGDRPVTLASVADITERKAAENVLRAHAAHQAMMFSEGLLGDFTWDIERDEVEAHATVFKLYGSPPVAGPVPGAWFRARQHPEDALDVELKWQAQIQAGSELAVEFRVNGDDGVMRWIDCRGVAVRDASGRPSHIHGLNIDITSRKQAEIARRRSEARVRDAEEQLRTAVHFSNAAVWRWHLDEDVTEWSGSVAELTGSSPHALGSFAAFKKIVYPADLGPLEEAVANSLAAGCEFQHEFRIVRAGGEVRWLVGRGEVLRDLSDRVCGITGVIFDITARKNAEEELTQTTRNFRELTKVLPQIVFTANASGIIDYYNDRYFEITGLKPSPQAALRWAETISDEDRDRTLAAWSDCVASGEPYENECRFWNLQCRQHRWHLVRAVPIRDADGAIFRWIGAATDVHDQKMAEERLESEVQARTLDLNKSLVLLRQREEQLRNSLQEKDALLREIHHRVKNNLQIVSSLLGMQAANAADAASEAALRDSERRISTMAMLHEQLYGTDDMQTVEFAEHARQLSQSSLASMAENPRISCRLDLNRVDLTIHQAIPCALILNELLTNALKYAYPNEDGGEIMVHLSCYDEKVTLVVSDQGVGLPPNFHLQRSKTLGLEIVHVLAQQLEGQLIVAGPPGASFSVRFVRQQNATPSDNNLVRSALAAH